MAIRLWREILKLNIDNNELKRDLFKSESSTLDQCDKPRKIAWNFLKVFHETLPVEICLDYIAGFSFANEDREHVIDIIISEGNEYIENIYELISLNNKFKSETAIRILASMRTETSYEVVSELLIGIMSTSFAGIQRIELAQICFQYGNERIKELAQNAIDAIFKAEEEAQQAQEQALSKMLIESEHAREVEKLHKKEMRAERREQRKLEIRRITVLQRRWLRRGNSYVTEIELLYNVSDKKLENHLLELNRRMRVYDWEVLHDFKFNTKRDASAFYSQCIKEYFDPNGISVFARLGKVMVNTCNPVDMVFPDNDHKSHFRTL